MNEKIVAILKSLRPEFDFTDGQDFIEEGMLDSFDIVSLVDALEENFGIVILGEEVLPENFNSIESISRLVESHKK